MSASDAVHVAERFLAAIVWGEHVTVWQLLSPAGRDRVLQAGSRRGLDALQAARLRQGTSPQEELDAFLTGLVRGLRVDLAGVPLDEVGADPEPVSPRQGIIEVTLSCPAAFGDGRWAAGSLLLSQTVDSWLVDSLQPIVSRSE